MQQQQLYKNLFQQSSPKLQVTELLKDEAGAYPYFGLLHYFRLKETNPGQLNYETIAGKAALHFNNPYLLHLKINETEVVDKETKIVISENLITNKTTEEKLLTPNFSNTPKSEELLFEPLFVTDYFAAQGIKLSEEALTGDKLGKQLKSFTEWLKTMKKVNGNRLQESTKIDKTVEKLAEKSNIETEVITEAMADVFVKQGKLEKANEIYQKLSLHNPAKSSYFANKIELLKEK